MTGKRKGHEGGGLQHSHLQTAGSLQVNSRSLSDIRLSRFIEGGTEFQILTLYVKKKTKNKKSNNNNNNKKTRRKHSRNGREIKKVTEHQDSLPLCSAPVKYTDI